MQKLKDRLMAKEFEQNVGVDYIDTFSFMVKAVTIKGDSYTSSDLRLGCSSNQHQ